PDNRFPSGVRPLNANYVPGNEKDVLAPAEDDFCDLHSANSPTGIKILLGDQELGQLELQIGESVDIRVVGISSSKKSVGSLSNLKVASNNGNVNVTSLNGNTYRITAISSGTSQVTATLSEGSISYSDTVSIIITKNEDEIPIDEPDDDN